jgi:hypothetical protein
MSIPVSIERYVIACWLSAIITRCDLLYACYVCLHFADSLSLVLVKLLLTPPPPQKNKKTN